MIFLTQLEKRYILCVVHNLMCHNKFDKISICAVFSNMFVNLEVVAIVCVGVKRNFRPMTLMKCHDLRRRLECDNIIL